MSIEITICNNCPCLNTDYESGSNCNLGYDTNFTWLRKADRYIVKDTLAMRSHQDDFDLYVASFNCKLVKIITQDNEFYPNRFTTENHDA